ncbi:phospholipid carrier-dependent glycosyltransferase [candidate division WOR-3 bacterium]|nr:phospholipid carrier-dependent glycosyltransferase [candidate division WOR-3 bacterium]
MKPAGRLLTAALVLTILTRLIFVLLPRVPLETKVVASVGDSREYIALASNLADSRTFTRDTVPPFRPELFRTPAYPLLLAAPLLLAPPSSFIPSSPPSSFILLSLVLQLLLSLLTVWLTHRLALELGLAPATAAFAALLVGLSPNLAFLSSKLISEALFIPLLLVCMILLNRCRRTASVAGLVAAGVCSGLLILTRPIATFFPLLIAVYLIYRALNPRAAAHRLSPIASLVFLAAASVVVAPWVIRNGRKTGRYIISTASEHNIYLYDAATVVASQKGITIPQARDVMMAEAEKEYGRIDTTDEATMWQKLSAVARRHFFRNPARAAPVWLFGVAADFLNPISVGPLLIHSGAAPAPGSANLLQSSLALLVKGRVTQALRTAWKARIGGAPTFILVVLACAFVFNLVLIWFGFASLFLRRTRGLFWLLLPIIYFTFVTGTVGDARFRAPIEPLLCLLAAVALVRPLRPAPTKPPDLSPELVSELTRGSCSVGLGTPGTHA